MTTTAQTSSKVELTIDAGVATIALNRPEVRNAISKKMIAPRPKTKTADITTSRVSGFTSFTQLNLTPQ